MLHSKAALEQTYVQVCLPLTPQATWIHQIHIAGALVGSTTMVRMFTGLVVCLVGLMITHAHHV